MSLKSWPLFTNMLRNSKKKEGRPVGCNIANIYYVVTPVSCIKSCVNLQVGTLEWFLTSLR